MLRRLTSIVLLPAAALVGCSSDDTAGTDTATSTAGTASTSTASTSGGTSAGTSGGSSGSGSVSETGTGSSGTTSGGTTSGTTSGGPTSGSTSADTSGSTAVTVTDGTSSTTGDPQICAPASKSCFDDSSYQVCDDDGLAWGAPVDCAENEGCYDGECLPLCELVKQEPSSVGCSFFANRMDNLYANQPDSLIVGNVSTSLTAKVQLYFVPNGMAAEQPVGAPIDVPPSGTYTFTMDNAQIESVTTLRKGGVYRVESSLPIVAYLHSPIGSQATNDASMLLPEHALTGNYIVSSYPGTFPTHYPSYFTAIATEDGTTLNFLAGIATAGGGGVPALAKGQATDVAMSRYDTLNVVVSVNYTDLSGTIISADKPVWVAGATECGNVPMYPTTYCDHLEEVSIPLEYWGDTYVGAHAPQRGSETFYWRVYSGDDGVTISTSPQQPGFPKMLNKGEYYQFGTKESFMFTGDGPFLPVQYLEGQNGGAGTGDPSMYQMVPTEQFLTSYAFVTGTNYNQHYAQVIRPVGGADVLVDGQVVGGYYTVGNYEVADWKIAEGAHFATSDDPFGVIQVGYTPVTSYAYPGGLKLKVINPQ
ncbi:MAG: IgGFc-binding protein [Myxococcales bacterium]|nr:IgGFc-binding protein [Myxococcales bacterium]